MNQPRLTTEDDQVITIPNNNSELLMEEVENEQVIFYIRDIDINILYNILYNLYRY